jgi:WD40 repeat protein
VQRELSYWLQKDPDGAKLLIAIAEGQIVWDDQAGDFDWTQTNALPRLLAGRFKHEPRYSDFRGVITDSQLSLRNLTFMSEIAGIAATLRGVPKDTLIGDDIREHRTLIRLGWSAGVILSVMTIVAVLFALSATHQRNVSLARQFAAQADLLLNSQQPGLIERSALLAIESLRTNSSPEAESILRHDLEMLPRLVADMPHAGATNYDKDSVLAIAFSPDGMNLVTASSKWIRIWSVPGGKEIERIEHDGDLFALTVSSHGRYLGGVRADGTIRIWDLQNKQLLPGLSDHPKVYGSAFSTDEDHLILVGRERHPDSPSEPTLTTVCVHSLLTGREIVPKSKPEPATSVALSSGGDYLATSSTSGIVTVVEVMKRQPPRHLRVNSPVSALCFGPNPRYLAVATLDKRLQVWDIHTATVVLHLTLNAVAFEVTFSKDGMLLATASTDDRIRIWDRAGSELSSLPAKGRLGRLAFSPATHLIAVTSGSGMFSDGGYGSAMVPDIAVDQVVRVWNTDTGHESFRVVDEKDIMDFAFSPDGKYLATGGIEGHARLWELSRRGQFLRGAGNNSATAVTFSRDGHYLVAGYGDGAVILWDLSSKQTWRVMHREGPVYAVAFSPDGQFVAAAGPGGTALWELASGIETAPTRGTLGSAGSVAFSQDSRLLATGSAEGGSFPPRNDQDDTTCTVVVWDVRTNRSTVCVHHTPPIVAVGFAPPSVDLTTVSASGNARIWNLTTGKSDWGVKMDSPVHAASISSDAMFIVTASADNTASVWPVFKWFGLLQDAIDAQMRHESLITDVVFNSDGKLIATASEDGTIRMFDSTSGSETNRMELDRVPRRLALSPNGQLMAIADDSGVAVISLRPDELIEEACQALIRNFTWSEAEIYFGQGRFHKTCPNLR